MQAPLNSLFFVLLFQAALLAAASMLLTWFLAVKKKNAGLVDIAWAGLFTPIVLLFAILGDGLSERKLLCAVLVCLWSVRLSTYLWSRARGGPEDPRYAALRSSWGDRADWRFLAFFELKGLVVVLLCVPFAIICLNPNPQISGFELIGTAVWGIGFATESIADRQLHRFKQSATRDQVMNRGLWKYSRHPNYFGEWLMWCGYFLIALGSPFGWAAIYCPVLIYFVLTRATGIPLAEAQAKIHRGEGYLEYQRRTSAFFPWFARSKSNRVPVGNGKSQI